jgi:hypothetical protein
MDVVEEMTKRPPEQRPLAQVVAEVYTKVEVLGNDVTWLKRIMLWMIAGTVANAGLLVVQIIQRVGQ